MRTAIVHDWLTGMRGGERCLQAFLSIYPQADIYTMVHMPGRTTQQIDQRVKAVSWMGKLPWIGKYYRALLPLYPLALSSFHLDDYDLVISLSHAAAKNVRIRPGQRHICYCFTPMRYIWDQAPLYFGAALPAAWPLIRKLRTWDRDGSQGVDEFVAISKFVAARIRCFYAREARVIYPPVESSWIKPLDVDATGRPAPGQAFLMAGALVPYKRPQLVIAAFNRLKLPLWVVGSGPLERQLRKLAGPSVDFFGQVSDVELAELYRRCRALVFAAEEDFGMVPVECMAAGRPVIGLYAGGCRETICGYKPWESGTSSKLDASQATGVFIRHSRGHLLEALIQSIEFFLEMEDSFLPEACVRHADNFGLRRFVREWQGAAQELGVARQRGEQVLADDWQANSPLAAPLR